MQNAMERCKYWDQFYLVPTTLSELCPLSPPNAVQSLSPHHPHLISPHHPLFTYACAIPFHSQSPSSTSLCMCTSSSPTINATWTLYLTSLKSPHNSIEPIRASPSASLFGILTLLGLGP